MIKIEYKVTRVAQKLLMEDLTKTSHKCFVLDTANHKNCKSITFQKIKGVFIFQYAACITSMKFVVMSILNSPNYTKVSCASFHSHPFKRDNATDISFNTRHNFSSDKVQLLSAHLWACTIRNT